MPNDPQYRQHEMDFMTDHMLGNINKTTHQLNVEQFMLKAGQKVPDKPTIPSDKDCVLRSKLIIEESLETSDALGVSIFDERTGEEIYMKHLKFVSNKEPDIVKIIDGCCDISVVTTGTLSSCGIEDRPVLKAVDFANLRKFGPGGHRRDDGKWIKPSDFVGPEKDITDYLESKND